MPTTPNAALRYPDLTNAPNIPLDLGNLASDVDGKAHVTVANITARNALIKWDGLRVYVSSEKRIWLWDAAATAWQYAGGAPPPIVALQSIAGPGFTASTSYTPGVFKDASGMVRLVGGITNSGAYTPSNSLAFVIPTGYRPAVDQGFLILVATGSLFINLTIQTSGSAFMSQNNGVSIPGGSVHTLDQVAYHPGYTGTIPYA